MRALVAGGGIGGLAAALALSRAGWDVGLLERAQVFSEAGAGIQLGPNVVRCLHAWGLGGALEAVAAHPDCLQVRSATSGQLLAQLSLDSMASRYGAPYLTVHRADLHAMLLRAVKETQTHVHVGTALTAFEQTPRVVQARTGGDLQFEGDVLIGADGLWSSVRAQLLGDGPPRSTGHLAWRALVSQAALPEKTRTQNITVWLGPKMHIVHYPVRCGEWLNVVAIVHGKAAGDAEGWDRAADPEDLAARLTGCCTPLRHMLQALQGWRLWSLHDRPAMQGAYQAARGRVALLGDAAHPMLPYLAQGAGMAIEDAAALGRMLLSGRDQVLDVPVLLQRYAQERWRRNARVQTRAASNGRIFHAQGVLRWGRDAAMRLLGQKLLDMPWLYGAGRGAEAP